MHSKRSFLTIHTLFSSSTIPILFAPPGAGKTRSLSRAVASSFPKGVFTVFFLQPNHEILFTTLRYLAEFWEHPDKKIIYYMGVEKHCPIAMDDDVFEKCLKDEHCQAKIQVIENAFGEDIRELRKKFRKGYPLRYFCKRCPFNDKDSARRVLATHNVIVPDEASLLTDFTELESEIKSLRAKYLLHPVLTRRKTVRGVCPRTIYFFAETQKMDNGKKKFIRGVDNSVVLAPHSVYTASLLFAKRSAVIIDEIDVFLHSHDTISSFTSDDIVNLIEIIQQTDEKRGDYYKKYEEKVLRYLAVDEFIEYMDRAVVEYKENRGKLWGSPGLPIRYNKHFSRPPVITNKFVEALEDTAKEKMRDVIKLMSTLYSLYVISKKTPVKQYVMMNDDEKPEITTYTFKEIFVNNENIYIVGMSATLPQLVRNVKTQAIQVRLLVTQSTSLITYTKTILPHVMQANQIPVKMSFYATLPTTRKGKSSPRLFIPALAYVSAKYNTLIVAQSKRYAKYVVTKLSSIGNVKEKEWGWLIERDTGVEVYITWLRSKISRGVDVRGIFSYAILYGNIYPHPHLYLPRNTVAFEDFKRNTLMVLRDKTEKEELLLPIVYQKADIGTGIYITPAHSTVQAINEFWQAVLRAYRSNARHGINYVKVAIPDTQLKLLLHPRYKPPYLAIELAT